LIRGIDRHIRGFAFGVVGMLARRPITMALMAILTNFLATPPATAPTTSAPPSR
jgi:hypothetical protein